MPTAGNKKSRMFRQAPDYYRESLVMSEIWGTIAEDLALAGANDDDIILQLDIETATWGLDIWEKTLGLSTFADKPLSQRRERIKSKLRGHGTVNADLLKAVAESYDGGTIEVINSWATYQVTLKFISTLGTPANVADLQAAIDDIKPAHLEILWSYRYLRINEVHEVLTLAQVEALTLDKFAG